ncbi:hypothetical protein HMPREF9244_01388 [Alloscardovia omnicolens F0580]|uniref:Uncharacterized protein n=1 Tax=Alloscardovia omnicolens F0580 TaxID=1321816 RepID=U1QR29_9BIFI|nr:hypothetical protein HMPREF9244_01388 [Alloscardovia omnicolens F0580]
MGYAILYALNHDVFNADLLGTRLSLISACFYAPKHDTFNVA